MNVLRVRRDLLSNVLRSFLDDPIVEWEKSNNDPDIWLSLAILKMQKLENRLRGQVGSQLGALSVKGYVNYLLKEATSDSNLSQMYIGMYFMFILKYRGVGWMAWL